MVIADVLDVDVDYLVHRVRTPEQELKDIRRNTEAYMRQLDTPFSMFTFGLLETKWFLEDHPELTAQVIDEHVGSLSEPDDYLPWVAKRMQSLSVDDDDLVPMRTALEADQLVEIMIAWMSQRIGPDKLKDQDNRVDPEKG